MPKSKKQSYNQRKKNIKKAVSLKRSLSVDRIKDQLCIKAPRAPKHQKEKINKNIIGKTFSRKRKLNESTPKRYGTKRRCLKNTDNIEANVDVTDVHTILPKIILGDFSQYSYEFPKPQTQCTAMAATALAYMSLKSFISWDAYDLNIILRAGQIYYEIAIFVTSG